MVKMNSGIVVDFDESLGGEFNVPRGLAVEKPAVDFVAIRWIDWKLVYTTNFVCRTSS
jgi:hypothetical protein